MSNDLPPTSIAPAPLSQTDERLWATLIHVSAILGIVIGVGLVGWLGPLIIFLVFKDRSAFVAQHGRATLNFQITMAIAAVVAALLWIVVVGILITGAIYVVVIVFSIIAAIAANRGEPYTYPLSIRFLK
jgi:uncharacterized Tic20 family protein